MMNKKGMKFKVTMGELRNAGLYCTHGFTLKIRNRCRNFEECSSIKEIKLEGEPVECRNISGCSHPHSSVSSSSDVSPVFRGETEKSKKIQEIKYPNNDDWVTTGTLKDKINEIIKHINEIDSKE